MYAIYNSLKQEAKFLKNRGWAVTVEIKIDDREPLRFKVEPKKSEKGVDYEMLLDEVARILVAGHDVKIRMARKELALDRDQMRPIREEINIPYTWKAQAAVKDIEANEPGQV